MTFLEAAKSGKRFKRDQEEARWFHFDGETLINDAGQKWHRAEQAPFLMCWLMANDWIIEEKKVTISLTDLADAYKRASRYTNDWHPSPKPGDIAKELGLLE